MNRHPMNRRPHRAFAALVTLAAPAAAQDAAVTINDTVRSAKCVVHELTDDGTKDRAVRFVEGVRDRFFRGAEVVDATRADPTTLAEKLRGGFVLFSSFGRAEHPVLDAAIAPLGAELRSGSLELRGARTPLAETRLIFVGANPYADGRVVVYSAGTNALLDGINSLFHGPRSYHLFRGAELVAEGDYDAAFAFAVERLPLAEAIEDATCFFASLERAHPDLLHRVTFDDYVATRRATIDGIAARADASRMVTVRDLAFVLYRAAASFGDGHTSVHWTRRVTAADAAATRFPPFTLDYRNGTFVVDAAADGGLVGRAVTTIEGEPIRDFLRPILERCAAETEAFAAARLVARQAFWWWFTGLLDGREQVRVGLGDGDTELETIGLDRFVEIVGRRSTRARSTTLAILRDGRAGHLRYPAFVDTTAERERIERAFEELADRGVTRLVIDIRGNGGGSSSVGEYLLSFLCDRPFRTFSGAKVKLSRDLLAQNPGHREMAGHEGLIVTYRGDERRRERPAAFFTGKVVLLVDNGSFSAASGFAAMVRDYEVGEIVGYETGGLPSSFGDVLSLTLPNSRIPYGVSHKQFLPPRPRPGDDEHGVLPDVPATEEALAPFATEDDPVLALALARAGA